MTTPTPPTDSTIRKRQYRSTLSTGPDGNVSTTFQVVLNQDQFPSVETYAIANSSDILVIVMASETQDKEIIAIEGVSAA